MPMCETISCGVSVTSYAEVWIEILKFLMFLPFALVTSYAEVWIEICAILPCHLPERRHLLRGGVD